MAHREVKETATTELFFPARACLDEPCPTIWGEARGSPAASLRGLLPMNVGKQVSRPPEAAATVVQDTTSEAQTSALAATGWAALSN